VNPEPALVCLGLVILPILAVCGVVIYLVGLSLWQRWHEVRAAVDLQRLAIDRARLQVVERVPADERGVFPLLWDGTRALDPNTATVFSIQAGVERVTPALAWPAQITNFLRAAGGWPASAAQGLLEPPQPVVSWPGRVRLGDLLTGPPSYRALVLGVTCNSANPEVTKPGLPAESGPGAVVRGDMTELVHVAVGGSSGWGKSVFLRALAYQLALSVDPVDLVLVDLEGTTFAPFARCDRLLWPVADTETDALAAFVELTGELDRRKVAFAEHPGVDSLTAYNAQSPSFLPPVVCLVDEATALLSDKGVESALRTLALRARKYGLWLVLGGQDWKATSLDTAIRNQLAARVQFKAMSASQSRVLLQQPGAEALDTQGRALAWLPGRGLVEMQAPYISRQDILAAVAGGGPRQALPALAEASDDQAEHIRELHAEGLSRRQIQLQVFGYDGGKAARVVREALGSDTTRL